MVVNNARKHNQHLALVNADFLMTSTLSISLGTKFLTFISRTSKSFCFEKRKYFSFMFYSSIDDLISQLITAERQDKHVQMRRFNRSSPGPLKKYTQ